MKILVIGFLLSILSQGLLAQTSGYVCVGGYLYKPDSSKEYVGSSDCASARLGIRAVANKLKILRVLQSILSHKVTT